MPPRRMPPPTRGAELQYRQTPISPDVFEPRATCGDPAADGRARRKGMNSQSTVAGDIILPRLKLRFTCR